MRYVIGRTAPVLGGLDSFFDDFFSDVSTRKYPPVDIYETADAYTIELEVAGYSDDDIKITVKDGVITIASDPSWKERLRKRDGINDGLHRFEPSYTISSVRRCGDKWFFLLVFSICKK